MEESRRGELGPQKEKRGEERGNQSSLLVAAIKIPAITSRAGNKHLQLSNYTPETHQQASLLAGKDQNTHMGRETSSYYIRKVWQEGL